MFLQRADGGAPELLDEADLPIGVDESARYHTDRVALAPGDRVLAYTDGATDILIGTEARLGSAGWRNWPPVCPSGQGRHRLEALYSALLERSASVQPDDDITLLSCLVR